MKKFEHHFSSNKYFLFDLIFLSIISIGLFTAHLDIVRFVNVFKKAYLDLSLNYNHWDLPWFIAQNYPNHDYPYSGFMYLITSIPTYLYKSIINNPSEFGLIVAAKIPIIITFIIFYIYLKSKLISKSQLLLLLISPQIIFQQIIAGQYDIIVYVLLYISIIQLLDNIQDSHKLFVRFVCLSSIIAFIKLTVLVVSFPVSLFLLCIALKSNVRKYNNFKNEMVKLLSILGFSYVVPLFSELLFRYNSIYYSREVGSGASILIRNTNPLPFSSFYLTYFIIILLAIYAGIKLNTQKIIFNERKDIILILMIMVGLAFSIHTSNSLGWTSIISISYIGLSYLTCNNLKKYLYIYFLAYFILFSIMPNSPFIDSFEPIINFFQHKENVMINSNSFRIGYIYFTIKETISSDIANSIWGFSKLIYPISSLIMYQKSFKRIIHLCKI